MTERVYMLEPRTGFKLMEHLDVHHLEDTKGPEMHRLNARELGALHQKLHNLKPDLPHTHRKSRAR